MQNETSVVKIIQNSNWSFNYSPKMISIIWMVLRNANFIFAYIFHLVAKNQMDEIFVFPNFSYDVNDPIETFGTQGS